MSNNTLSPQSVPVAVTASHSRIPEAIARLEDAIQRTRALETWEASHALVYSIDLWSRWLCEATPENVIHTGDALVQLNMARRAVEVLRAHGAQLLLPSGHSPEEILNWLPEVPTGPITGKKDAAFIERVRAAMPKLLDFQQEVLKFIAQVEAAPLSAFNWNEDGANCSLQLVGEVWHICFRGEKGDYPDQGNQCIAWLVKLLRAPNRRNTVANLRGDPEDKLAADANLRGLSEMDSRTIKDLRNKIEEIDDIAELTGGSEAHENEKADLLKRLKGRSGKQLLSQLKRDHANIATQLRNLVKKLKKDMPQLAAHLKTSLLFNFPEFGYYPPNPPPDWKI